MGHESSFKPERLMILEAFLTTRTLRKHNEEEELFFSLSRIFTLHKILSNIKFLRKESFWKEISGVGKFTSEAK